MKTSFVSWSINSDLIDINEDGEEIYSPDYVLIDKVFVPKKKRGKGEARKILAAELVKIAELHPEMTIKLAAYPTEKCVDLDRLVKFYEKMGFSVDEDQAGCHAVIMSR
jgi:predicted GNAT superfamily acetyltransferase